MKKIFTIILIGMVLIISYILLNKSYVKAVNSCIEAGNNVKYCEYHAG